LRLGVDNAYVDLGAPEVPIMDAAPRRSVLLVKQAGIGQSGRAEAFLRLTRAH